jgi:hypothetical protein
LHEKAGPGPLAQSESERIQVNQTNIVWNSEPSLDLMRPNRKAALRGNAGPGPLVQSESDRIQANQTNMVWNSEMGP